MESKLGLSWESCITEYALFRNGYNEDIWSDLGHHPLDQILDNLARIYLVSQPVKKKVFKDALINGNIEPWDLVLYIRRLGPRLISTKKEEMIDWAIGFAALTSDILDPRDVFVSLTLLMIGAEKAGVRIENLLKIPEPSGMESVMDMLARVVRQSKESRDITIKMYGPPEWKAKS